MAALLITLTSIFSYFGIGYWLAVRDMPNLWARTRKQWSYEDTRWSAVQGGTVLTFFLWPFRWPLVLLFNTADRRDPERLEKEIRERDARIAELERRLL
jgi:hypothetical protein